MTLNLMPAELVAKDAELDYHIAHGICVEFMADDEADVMDLECVRHAWIVAAEALEEKADKKDREFHLLTSLNAERRDAATQALRSAARALHKAAEEGREP